MGADEYLKERGRAMWTSFGGPGLPPGKAALLLEACRMADGLDKLDAILGGRKREWVKILPDDMGEVTLIVDGLLTERRQQQVAFAQLVDKMRAAGLEETAVTKKDEPVDELTRLRQEKAKREAAI